LKSLLVKKFCKFYYGKKSLNFSLKQVSLGKLFGKRATRYSIMTSKTKHSMPKD
jgi:hypothetical protein